VNLLWIGGGQPGLPELLIVVAVVVMLFGAKRLPELARSMGRSISEFKKGRQEGVLLEEGDKTTAETSTEKSAEKQPSNTA
jgi:sec-independent protein translocase protein TatA